MALFNAPLPVAVHELRAVTAAILMHEQLDHLNTIWKQKGYPEVRVRIGINTAVCLLGHIGSETRINYTALGKYLLFHI
jgi:adenylate cyclase